MERGLLMTSIKTAACCLTSSLLSNLHSQRLRHNDVSVAFHLPLSGVTDASQLKTQWCSLYYRTQMCLDGLVNKVFQLFCALQCD